MVTTMIYYNSNSKVPQIKAFDDIKNAESWLDEAVKKGKDVQNAQLFVGYAEVSVYKEKFEELYAILLDRAFDIKKDEKKPMEFKVE